MKEIKKKLFLSRPLPFKFFDLYPYIFFGKEEVPSSILGIGSSVKSHFQQSFFLSKGQI